MCDKPKFRPTFRESCSRGKSIGVTCYQCRSGYAEYVGYLETSQYHELHMLCIGCFGTVRLGKVEFHIELELSGVHYELFCYSEETWSMLVMFDDDIRNRINIEYLRSEKTKM